MSDHLLRRFQRQPCYTLGWRDVGCRSEASGRFILEFLLLRLFLGRSFWRNLIFVNLRYLGSSRKSVWRTSFWYRAQFAIFLCSLSRYIYSMLKTLWIATIQDDGKKVLLHLEITPKYIYFQNDSNFSIMGSIEPGQGYGIICTNKRGRWEKLRSTVALMDMDERKEQHEAQPWF